MIVVVTQPQVFTYLNMLERFASCHVWVVLGSAQWTKQASISRFKYDKSWVSVPMEQHSSRAQIREIRMANDPVFREKLGHMLKIVGTPMHIVAKVSDLLEEAGTTRMPLDRLGVQSTELLMSEFGVRMPKVVYDYELMEPLIGDPDSWMLALTKKVGATSYYGGKATHTRYVAWHRWASESVEFLVQGWMSPIGRNTSGLEVFRSLTETMAIGRDLVDARRRLASRSFFEDSLITMEGSYANPTGA